MKGLSLGYCSCFRAQDDLLSNKASTTYHATILWEERSRLFDSVDTVRVRFESFMSVEVASQSTTSPELLRSGATWPSCRLYAPSLLRSLYSTS